MLAAAFFAEPTRALAPSRGHVLRRRKHPGAGPASHAGRTARTPISHRDASRVEPAWSGEGSVRPLASGKRRRAGGSHSPHAACGHPGGKTWARVACRAQPPTAQPVGDQAGQGGGGGTGRARSPGCWRSCGRSRGGPGGPRYGRTCAGAGRPAHVSLFWLRSAGGHEPGLSGARWDGPGSRGASDRSGRLAMCGAGSGDRRDAAARANGLCRIANDRRFLVLPWVRVPHLASHLRGGLTWRMAARFRTGARDRWKPTRADKVPPGTE
jgi:hypothetical protein